VLFLAGERDLKVVAISGGVGGAKMADGLAAILPPSNVSVIVNVADDFEWFGLTVCPDLDTVVYTLAGMENAETGWGIQGDTFVCFESLKKIDDSVWFKIGDQDLATHLIRSRWLWEGATLTEVARRLCQARHILPHILPATDDMLRTMVETDAGDLAFQEYFVHRQCQPAVHGFHWRGLPTAAPTEEVRAALRQADLVVLCPSNPFVSIRPILELPDLREMIAAKPAIAVSPLIGGQAVKGPAAKMFRELGRMPSAGEVAKEYRGLLAGFVLDAEDRAQLPEIQEMGIQGMATDTRMPNRAARKRLASEVLDFCRSQGWA
jgi:LPPG:FO 2-phospho-L-lactate transferase